MSPRPAFDSVPAYLAALDPQQKAALQSVLAVVAKASPKATPVISYGIPAFKLDKVFIYCAAFKHHIGIYPPVQGDANLSKALEPYANAKGNLSFALDQPLPLSLIRKVARALARQNLARTLAGSGKKPRTRKNAKTRRVAAGTASRG